VVIGWGQEGLKTSAAEMSDVVKGVSSGVHCVDDVNRRLAFTQNIELNTVEQIK
jgi:hypothetical protein